MYLPNLGPTASNVGVMKRSSSGSLRIDFLSDDLSGVGLLRFLLMVKTKLLKIINLNMMGYNCSERIFNHNFLKKTNCQLYYFFLSLVVILTSIDLISATI